MEADVIIRSLGGGMLIGLAAVIVLLSLGKVAGVSGIACSVASRDDAGRWRVAFLLGLAAAGAVGYLHSPEHFRFIVDRSYGALVAAGVLVGLGTRMGSGCTSGHGVCGVGRLSPRSIVATATFLTTGVLTVWLVRVLFGGSL